MDQRLVAVRPKNKMASVGSLRNGCATIGRSQLSQRNMPRELEANLSEIRRTWRTSFDIAGGATVRTVALRREIFKWKKGSVPLIYASSTIPWSYLNHNLVTLSL
jgi:hypothetical protein